MKQILFFFFISINIFSQNENINLLDEVKLHGNLSRSINCGYSFKVIKDSTLVNNAQTLGDLLQQHSNIYFKQNGNGMVSSISLRGTGASHTSVYWNGISINSSLIGQTDFNTVSANGFDEVEVRKGAGSTLFGSGAIGGVINLKDKINFSKSKTNYVSLGLSSFNTQSILISSSQSFNNIFYKINVEGVKSDNDYPYLDTDIVNENAKYKNYQIKTVLAYKLNNNNQLKLFTNYSNNYRELSRSLTAPSENLYKNEDNRILLNWLNTNNKYNSDFRIAYLNENYKFFLDKNLDDFSFGKSDNYILKYDFTYFIKKYNSIQLGFENKYTQGEGSNLSKNNRNVIETYALFHHKPFNKLSYNLSARKGFSNIFDIPLIYAFDSRFKFNNYFNLRANYSTNYKLPTFNDLFWEFSGNKDLKPETSNSVEIGFDFNSKLFNSNINIYQIKSTNLIQWQPVTATFWRPVNVQSVTSKGIEFDLNYHFHIKKHNFAINTQYSYTKSIDNNLNKQLMYVPFNKISGNFNYYHKGWSFNYNAQFTDYVYTTTSNTLYVPKYWLHSIQLNKKVYKNIINIGFKINNLLNKYYEVVAYRPMPNRNFKLNIKIKI